MYVSRNMNEQKITPNMTDLLHKHYKLACNIGNPIICILVTNGNALTRNKNNVHSRYPSIIISYIYYSHMVIICLYLTYDSIRCILQSQYIICILYSYHMFISHIWFHSRYPSIIIPHMYITHTWLSYIYISHMILYENYDLQSGFC